MWYQIYRGEVLLNNILSSSPASLELKVKVFAWCSFLLSEISICFAFLFRKWHGFWGSKKRFLPLTAAASLCWPFTALRCFSYRRVSGMTHPGIEAPKNIHQRSRTGKKAGFSISDSISGWGWIPYVYSVSLKLKTLLRSSCTWAN